MEMDLGSCSSEAVSAAWPGEPTCTSDSFWMFTSLPENAPAGWLELEWLEEYQPSWGVLLVVGVVIVYFVWYYLFVVHKPRLVGGGTKLKQHVLNHCPILSNYYYPTFWAANCHFSTIGREKLQKCPGVTYKRELLTLYDGGVLALDWAANLPAECDKDDAPVLLFLTGITGSSSDNYVKYSMLDGMRHGYRPVVMNYRGCGGIKLTTTRTYSATSIDDVRMVTHRIRTLYPNAAIVGIGISLGGMILTQYCHQLGEECDLKAVLSVSAILESYMSKENLEELWLNKVYTKYIAKHLCDIIQRNLSHLREKFSYHTDVPHLLKSRSISQFDERLTAPLFGYSSLNHYYDQATNSDKLHKICIPYVCLTASDDPFVPEKSIPFDEFKENPLTLLILTSRGGHFGFLEGLWPTKETWMNRVNRQLLEAFKKL